MLEVLTSKPGMQMSIYHQCKTTRKRNEKHWNQKGGHETVIISLCIILCIENPKQYTNKLLEIIGEFSQLQLAMRLTPKSHSHFIYNSKLENTLKMLSDKIKSLGINLAKGTYESSTGKSL